MIECTFKTNNVSLVQFIVSLEQLVTRVMDDMTTDVKRNRLEISVKVYNLVILSSTVYFNCKYNVQTS